MTVLLYARRKGWALDRVEVRLRHEKIHAEECAECETREGKVDRIELELLLGGELTAEQEARIREIALKCPVHRTLTSEVVIVPHRAI